MWEGKTQSESCVERRPKAEREEGNCREEENTNLVDC